MHRDIKPHNTLVFEERPGFYTAKIADLGHSVQLKNESDFIFMPRSEPWDAPEWHHRAHRLADTFKMDVYSFGMVCLWLLFSERLTEEGITFKFQCIGSDDLVHLTDLKSGDGLGAIATSLICKTKGLSVNQVRDLIVFFHSCLAFDKDCRDSDMDRLTYLLDQGSNMTKKFSGSFVSDTETKVLVPKPYRYFEVCQNVLFY